METETIAAIATAVGEAGIGIVRVSGPASVKIARAVFCSVNNKPVENFIARRMLYGKIVDTETGEPIDEALCVYMQAPHSYTCEDVFEFQLHGGTTVVRRVLELLLKEGARLARPGEFTERAYLNGRIDLSQAEAVMDIIQAKTEAALKNAASQLSGNLSVRISEIRKTLLNFLVHVEANLDYPEENIAVFDAEVMQKTLLDALHSVDSLLATAQKGKILREGLRTVIVGRPNVGKSSLLNALLGENRALVTEFPGTTRDSIEEYLNLRGIPLRIVDTAGLRESDDLIEQLGMQRTKDFLASAALILFLVDASQPLTAEDDAIFRSLPPVPVILVVNKIDLPQLSDSEAWAQRVGSHRVVSLSAKERTGFDDLEQAIEQLVFQGAAQNSEPVFINNSRHVESLNLAREQLASSLSALQEGLPVDCAIIDLRAVLESLGQITGETVSDEVVREIFAKFCLGK